MGKVYVGQDRLTLYVSTGSSLLEAGSVIIEGTDPSGSSMSPTLSTTIEDVDTGLVSYELQETDALIATAGTWTLWVKVNYIGGETAYGEPFHVNVYSPGS
jgi:hypothetical protein